MKTKELEQLNISDLNKKLAESRDQARELRFSVANNQLSKVRDLRKVKKDIARMLTILNKKRDSAETAASEAEQKD